MNKTNTKESPAPMITTAEQWRKRNQNIRPFGLPSGATFMVKTVDLGTLITKGKIPLSLLGRVVKLRERVTAAGSDPDPTSLVAGIGDEELEAIDRMCREISLVAVVEPRITRTTEADSICIDELPLVDVLAIQQECVKGDAAMYAPFFRIGQ